MGGGSTNSKQTSKTDYSATSTTNPYFTTSTDEKGNTVSNFADGTAGKTTFDYVNNNIGTLLDNYMNPTLNSTTNQAKMNQFNRELSKNTNNTLQNDIINPLANNNMLRSSQATNMYNNLSNQITDQTSNYANQLLADDQANTWNMINNLMSLYTQGYTGANTEENTSLKASTGNATTTSKSSGK